MSPHELETITWISKGKTLSETSFIMGLSYTAIRSNAERAKKKLKAVNTAHAVARAYQEGLLR